MSTHDLFAEDTDDAIQLLDTYYRDDLAEFAQRYPTEQDWFSVSYRDLTTSTAMREAAKRHDYLDVEDWLTSDPAAVHALLEDAVCRYDYPAGVTIDQVDIRISDLPEYMVYGVSELWKADPGEFCGVRGQVSKTDTVRDEAVEVAYECQRCGTMTEVPQRGQKREPHQCEGCEREGPFNAITHKSSFRPYQLARIQQPPEDTKGGEAAHIDVPLRGSLVESVEPGDRAVFTGRRELDAVDEDSPLFDPYLKPESAAVEETDFEEIDTSEYMDEIRAIAAGEYGDPAEAIVESIAPKVHGHDAIKLAMALQLFGGRQIHYPDDSRDRGDMHVLLIGAPGTAKSTLLEAAEELSPRSTYASGKGASAAGMTAAAVRDDFGETEWALEAGALVLANNGIACVDEIDKIQPEARSSMHTALESQRININKAGINATLPAETSLLAAGNPKYGRFDEYASESLSEQIDLGPTLLSRFDLIFVLQDKPDRERDSEIAEHIIESGRAATGATGEDGRDIEPTIPADVLRAYIAHAKQEVYPQITDDSIADDLSESFVEWRMLNGEGEHSAVPVTFRKLEGVRRLAQASARLRLSDTVEQQDIDRARQLVMDSMKQVGLDQDEQTFDADMVEAGTSKSQRDRVKTLHAIIEELEAEHDGGAPLSKVLNRAEEADIRRSKAEHEISRMKMRGEAYEPSGGCLRLS